MAPSFDCTAASSLLCAEDNNSLLCLDDSDYGDLVNDGFGRDEDYQQRNLQIYNQNHNFLYSEGFCIKGFPLQTEECLSLMIERESDHLPRNGYVKRLQSGDLDIQIRREAVDWIGKSEEGKDSIECEKPTQTVTVPSEPKVEIIARESSSTDVIKPAPVDKVETEKKPVESAPAVVAPLEKVEAEKKPVESAPAVVAPLEKVETAKNVESVPTVENVKPEEKVDAKKDADVTVEKASEVVIKNEQPALPVSSSSTADVKGVVAAETK